MATTKIVSANAIAADPADPFDPDGEIDPNNPGVHFPGEPIDLYITPDLAGVTAADIPSVTNRLMSWEGPSADLMTSTVDRGENPSGTTAGTTTGEWIYRFKSMQYITCYELGTDKANAKYMPRNWKFYLSKDGGETWILSDEREYFWRERDRQHWDIKPGFYNAYKLEVLNVCAGDYVRIKIIQGNRFANGSNLCQK